MGFVARFQNVLNDRRTAKSKKVGIVGNSIYAIWTGMDQENWMYEEHMRGSQTKTEHPPHKTYSSHKLAALLLMIDILPFLG